MDHVLTPAACVQVTQLTKLIWKNTLRQTISPTLSPTNVPFVTVYLVPVIHTRLINLVTTDSWFGIVLSKNVLIKITSVTAIVVCFLGAVVANPEDFEKFAVKNGRGSFSCSLCTKHAVQLTDIKRHIESIHFPNTFTYTCPYCSKQLGSNNAYLVHKKKCLNKFWLKKTYITVK